MRLITATLTLVLLAGALLTPRIWAAAWAARVVARAETRRRKTRNSKKPTSKKEGR
jgi:hypothetical protein